jgi:hypothetical protein
MKKSYVIFSMLLTIVFLLVMSVPSHSGWWEKFRSKFTKQPTQTNDLPKQQTPQQKQQGIGKVKPGQSKNMSISKPSWSQILSASERFVLVMNGLAVLDKETGLVWMQSPSTQNYIWVHAQSYCYKLEIGGRKGWHLPTIEQLASLVDSTQPVITLPSKHPFSNVQSNLYWSATASNSDWSAYASKRNPTGVWTVHFGAGDVYEGNKVGSYYAWCVRGGQSHNYH